MACGEEKKGCGEEETGCGEEEMGCGEEEIGYREERVYFGATILKPTWYLQAKWTRKLDRDRSNPLFLAQLKEYVSEGAPTTGFEDMVGCI